MSISAIAQRPCGWTKHLLAAAVAVGLSAAGALGQLYSNATPISIPNVGTASPYPSTITVAGGPASIVHVRVTLINASHAFWPDVGILLVSPTGQKIQLHAGADITGTTEFSTLPGSASPSGGNYSFSSPAPLGPYGNTLSALIGANANGGWSLYVQDFAGGDAGAIAGGWRIEFGAAPTPNIAPSPNAMTYQGRLTGGPANGAIDVRFGLFDDATSTNVFDRVSDVVTVSGVPLTNGLFTATADLGRVPTDRKTWLGIEVANPAGSAFVALTPRQPMTFAPLANSPAYVASNIANANNETTGVKATAGYESLPSGEFNGMKAIIENGTANCGRSGDVGFFTWECNTATSREIMRITGRGRVGIGTAAPTQALHVIGNILASGTITPSCGALKQNIAPMTDALDRLTRLEAVRFDWKPEEAQVRGFTHDLGFIAEDVAKVFPEVVFRDDQGAVIGLDYSRMSAVAVGAIKQLKSENEKIKADNADLKARLEKIEALLARQAAQEAAR